MKKFQLLFIGVVASTGPQTLIAQDLIIRRDGTEIEARILDVGENHVRYKRWTNPDGPIVTVSKGDLFLIKYQNGEKERFEAPPATTSPQPASLQEQVRAASAAVTKKARKTPLREKHYQIGVKLTGHLSFLSLRYDGEEIDSPSRISASGGVYCDYYPSLFGYGLISAGLDYSSQGGVMKTGERDIDIFCDYIHLNLSAGWRWDGFYLKVGPRLGFLTGNSGDIPREAFNTLKFSALFDLGWSGKHFDAGLMFDWGWTNTLKAEEIWRNSDIRSANSLFGITVSYRF